VPLHSFYDFPHPIAVAHRGGMESAPENTLAAFTAATALGFRHLETDVHVTSDGVLIAFHDEQLDRVTDRTGTIRDLPWSEVRAARIGGTDPVPTLSELLEAFPDSWFNVDAKSDDAVVALARTLQRHGAVARTCVAAFSDERLARVRKLMGPELCTAASPREVTRLIGRAKLRRSSATWPDPGRPGTPYQCVQVPERHGRVTIVTPSFLRAAHARGCRVHVWTINEAADMHRLLDMGVDGIMTDRPSVLRDVLVDRGEWG
jgi:glycerophosphoryl diester phosphodiesterase